MAKVLTEQPRLVSPSAYDPRHVGDGAPMHALLLHDVPRQLNNIQTYREPSFQFLHDISLKDPSDVNSREKIRYRIKDVGFGDGICMLGQAPIYVPIDAAKLRWSLGLYRDPLTPLDAVPVEVNLDYVTMYLCSEPLRNLRGSDPVATDEEQCRRFLEGDLTGAWTKNRVAVTGGHLGGSGDPVFSRVRSDTWANFAPRGVTNVNSRLIDPWAYLIVTAEFSAGVTGEQIRGAELSVWFEYDQTAGFLLDDATREGARNGKPALAQVERSLVATASRARRRGRPVLSWWGGSNIPTEANSESQVRRVIVTGSDGQPALGGIAAVVPIANAAVVPPTGLTLNHLDKDQVFHQLVPQSPGLKEDLNDDPQLWYPKHIHSVNIFGEHVSDYTSGPEAREVRVQIGEPGINGPRLPSGLIFERTVTDAEDVAGVSHPVMGAEGLPLDQFTMGSEILGVSPDANRDLRAVRTMINRQAREKLMHFGWGICRNGTLAFGWNATQFASTNQYRYILNPKVGEGGIAATVDGPGIEIPARYTSLARNTTVRAYVYAYAWMTGASGTGGLGIINRNNSGGMTSAFPLTHTPVITGTTPQWYPALGSFNGATAPFFNLNANPAYDCDNALLCAIKSGASDVMVGAWVIVVRALET